MKTSDIDFMKLISSDKAEFIISANAVSLCPGLIKLLEACPSSLDRVAELHMQYPKKILSLVLDYLHYKMRYLTCPDYNYIPQMKLQTPAILELYRAAKDLGI
jgi:hypothetical protein